MTSVKLRDLVARARACVGDIRAHADGISALRGRGPDSQILIRERRIAEAEAERI